MIRALLVGSHVNWRPKLDATLAEHGIRVDWWWASKADLGSIPDACELVLIATDHNSHTLSVPAADRTRQSGTKLVHFAHRRSKLVPLLTKFGYPRLAQASATPTFTPSTRSNEVVPVMNLPPPRPPSVLHGARYHALRSSVERERYTAMLHLLAAEPLASNGSIGAKLNLTVDQVGHVVAAVRETMGIAGGQISDVPRYETACRALGVSTTPRSEEPAPASTASMPPITSTSPSTLTPADPRQIEDGLVGDLVGTVKSSIAPTITGDIATLTYTGRDLYACRIALGESQRALAQRLHVNQGAISKIENAPDRVITAIDPHRIRTVMALLPKLGTSPATPPGTRTLESTTVSEHNASPPTTVPRTPSPDLLDVRSALALLREAMRAERVETVIVNGSDREQEFPRQIVGAGKSVVTRAIIVSETMEA